jgi:hypothetical protein
MEKEKLCPYARNCNFYLGKIEDKHRPRYFILNVFCRGADRGWSGCQRYNIYKNDLEPDDSVLPQSDRSKKAELRLKNK